MKLITFVVPCASEDDNIDRTLQSLMSVGDECEIMLIDHSEEGVGPISKVEEWQRRSDLVRAFRRPGIGHGGAVNLGITSSSGLYFKVINPGEWLDERAVKSFLMVLRRFRGLVALDMIVCNAVYEYEGNKKQKRTEYRRLFKRGEVFTWRESKRLSAANPILANSLVFRTEVLREMGLELPEGVAYSDFAYACLPLDCCNRLYYLDIDLCHCPMSSGDGTAREEATILAVDDQIAVTRYVIDRLAYRPFSTRKLRSYACSCLAVMMATCSVCLLLSGRADRELQYRDLWLYLRYADQSLYGRVRREFVMSGRGFGGVFGKQLPRLVYPMVDRVSRYS